MFAPRLCFNGEMQRYITFIELYTMCVVVIRLLEVCCCIKIVGSVLLQSSKLGGSPKPVACKIVHGRIK